MPNSLEMWPRLVKSMWPKLDTVINPPEHEEKYDITALKTLIEECIGMIWRSKCYCGNKIKWWKSV